MTCRIWQNRRAQQEIFAKSRSSAGGRPAQSEALGNRGVIASLFQFEPEQLDGQAPANDDDRLDRYRGR